MKLKITIFALIFLPLAVYAQYPDFSYAQYDNFLKRMKSIPNLIFLTQYEFSKTYDSTKIIVSLRHDVDVAIISAQKMAEIEAQNGVHSTYYILHTASYYHPQNDFEDHNNTVLEQIKKIHGLGHEIGIHNDLITLQVVYNIDPIDFLHKELQWLRDNGIPIYGSASHGSSYCKHYGYLNYYFWRECSKKNYNPHFPNVDTVIKDDGTVVVLDKADFSDFGLSYESYCTNYNLYYADCHRDKYGNKFNPTKIDISKWKPGDRIIILTHPIHWRNYNTNQTLYVYPNPAANEFNIIVQDAHDSEITVDFYTPKGQKVYTTTIEMHDGKQKLEIPNFLKNGLYFLRAYYTKENKTESYRGKLVIYRQ